MIKAKKAEMKQARIEQGYNQLDVCEGVKINLASYCKIENGRSCLRPKTAKKICDFLNRPFTDLFEIS